MTDSCIFCRIGNGEIPAKVLRENGSALAFLDVEPHAPGHTLVIPKVHASTLAELPREYVEPVFALAQEVAQLLESKLALDGMTIGINQGTVGGQAVPHLHVHLMPRFSGDGGGSIHTVVRNIPTQSLDDIYHTLTS